MAKTLAKFAVLFGLIAGLSGCIVYSEQPRDNQCYQQCYDRPCTTQYDRRAIHQWRRNCPYYQQQQCPWTKQIDQTPKSQR